MLDAAGIVLRVHYKSMKCDVSFSQGVYYKYGIWARWTFFHTLCKTFLPVYNSAEKSMGIFQSYDHRRTATFFYGSQCIDVLGWHTKLREVLHIPEFSMGWYE